MSPIRATQVLAYVSSYLVALSCAAAETVLQSRVVTLETGWRYRLAVDKDEEAGDKIVVAYDDADWKATRIPHMGHELSDEPPRSTKALWFRRKVDLPEPSGDTRLVLQITAGKDLRCWLNGQALETPFADQATLLVDVTKFAKKGENLLALQARHPGIHGFVRLHFVPPLHFGVRGLMVDVPGWTGGPARVRVRSDLENHAHRTRSIELRARVLGPDGKTLAETSTVKPLKLVAERVTPIELEFPAVFDPPLWSPETPQLCRVAIEVVEDKEVRDRQEASFGFRWQHFEADGPFTLNGRKVPVRGVVYTPPPTQGVPDRKALWEREIGLLKGMGLNFIRTAESVDQGFYDVCDRAGLLVTPQVNHNDLHEGTRSDVENTVREFFNHPAVVAWHSNGEGKDAPTSRELSQMTYFLRALDPTRSMICCELGWRSPGSVGLVDADVAGQGNYTGWYEGTLDNIGPYLDNYRALLRERYGRALPILVSNFGAAGDSELHVAAPLRNDYSHEYHTAFHERFYAEMARRPWLAGGFIFCYRDLQTEQPIPRHTWKGMLDLKDRKKDAYYFYQSRWTTEPIVHLAQGNWKSRDLWPAGGKRRVVVFSNQGQVELFHDGKSLGVKSEENNRFAWDVALHEGENSLRAAAGPGGKRVEDVATITVRFRPPAVEPRLVMQPTGGKRIEPQLTWNPIAGVERYLVFASEFPDVELNRANLVATVEGTSHRLEHPDRPLYYRVAAQAGTAPGPASFAVGRQPGSLQWRFMNSGWLLSSPALADLTGDGNPEIVIGSYNGFVYAVRNDGTLLWSFNATEPVLASPAVAPLAPGEPPAVIVNSATTLYVISNDGSLRWRQDGIRQFDRSVRSPALADLDGDKKLEIIVGSDTGMLLVYNADGTLRWKYSTAGTGNKGLNPTTCAVVDLPSGAGKGLCFATDDGVVYLLDAQGREVWKHDKGLGDHVVGTPPNSSTPAAGSLQDPGATTIIAGHGTLEALDLTGKVLWQRKDRQGFPQISELFRDGGRQIVLASGQELHVVDHLGRDVWTYKLPHNRDYFLQAPTCADLDGDAEPDLIAGTRAAKLLAISSRGKVMWSVKSDDELTGVAAVADINKDGIVDVVFGSRDGSLNVVSAGPAPPFALESNTYRANLARTGNFSPGITATLAPIQSPAIVQRHEDVAYGDDPLQTLDVYLPKAGRPTPVIIEFHGGGWRRGHKRQNDIYLGLLEKAIDSGMAVVSANYRLTPRAVWPAQADDAVRVVQFVRAHAKEWNLDSERVVLIGGSAGAHLSLWVGLHDELADKQSSDPVRQQSTRVRGIIDCWGPANLAHMELSGRAREALPQFFGCAPEEWDSPRIQALIKEASPVTYVSANDPPVLMIHTDNDDAKIVDNPSWKTSNAHSSLFGIELKRKLEAAGGRGELFIEVAGGKHPEWVDRAFAFLQEVFK